MRTQVAIRCLIVRGDNIILCNHKERGFYFLPGGGLEIGETVDECIFREINEEMGIDEKDVCIHDGIMLAIENYIKDSEGKAICDENGKPLYGINLVKKVDITADKIESQEGHIGFDAIKISELENVILYPEVIKRWVIETFGKKDKQQSC